MKHDQTERLSAQHKKAQGSIGIFGPEAQQHNQDIYNTQQLVKKKLEKEFPNFIFRLRKEISKKEINEALQKIDNNLGQTLFVERSNIKPDGGILEVQDDRDRWRVVLVSEAKYQGKDIENIKKGIYVGKNKDQVLMAAGNAIERAHKNISEVANYMLSESHFPYIIFLEGSNFLTKDIVVMRPDGTEVKLTYNDGTINRLDRLTAANYGLPLNTNLCKNRFIFSNNRTIMLQAASIYSHPNGGHWAKKEMVRIMLEVARESLRQMWSDFFQLTQK